MKFTLSWLHEHLDTNVDIKIIESKLNNIGLEVESIEDRVDELKSFTVAEVTNVSMHPNADKLSLCEVDIGVDSNLQIICGAPNVRKGLKVVVATVGSVLPNNLGVLVIRPCPVSSLQVGKRTCLKNLTLLNERRCLTTDSAYSYGFSVNTGTFRASSKY